MLTGFKQKLWTAFLAGALFSCSTQTTMVDTPYIRVVNPKVVDGSMVLVEARNYPTPPLKSDFEGKSFPFLKVDESLWISLVPVEFNSKPRTSKIVIQPLQQEFSIEVEDGKYKIENLTVEEKYVEPKPAAMKRINSEKKEVGAIYRQSTPMLFWRGNFSYPLDSEVTSPYGNKRYYNGQMRNFHSGLDLRAKVGTPVKASHDGKVIMAKDLYFTGNTVLIDHGYGLYTLYAHLDQLKVKAGDSVHQKDIIGLSGSTGRVSGPHLHWSFILNGEKLDPAQVLKLNFPTK